MEHLSHSINKRASKLKANILGMIERVLTATVTPLSVSINALAARIAVCERGQGATDEVTALKATIVELRKDEDPASVPLSRRALSLLCPIIQEGPARLIIQEGPASVPLSRRALAILRPIIQEGRTSVPLSRRALAILRPIIQEGPASPII
ncbi:hypothetical protein H5410_022356 [Solanum commersonii]|uniref:Uncharacterized protein n=1 Tax=Solanum commersonii TaxID=4109 RepID=A0A9J5ZDR2_SOLCO|nr:hypothetical protein H5410_022356 [Solanum commersonii]